MGIAILTDTFISFGEEISFQKTFRYLLRFYSLLFRGFFMAFSWPSSV